MADAVFDVLEHKLAGLANKKVTGKKFRERSFKRKVLRCFKKFLGVESAFSSSLAGDLTEWIRSSYYPEPKDKLNERMSHD